MLSYPDYERSLIGIVSSIKNYYRTSYEYPTLPLLDKELKKAYKNIVLIILDGLGTDMLVRNLSKQDFLRVNCAGNLTSVFPSSTVPAMTSYYSGLAPNEHGWLGWRLYFKEFNHTIDVFPNVDTYTKAAVTKTSAAEFVMPYETIFHDISRSFIGNIQPFTIAQKGVDIAETGNFHKTAEDFGKACEIISRICETEQNTFTFVQWNSPDDVAHKYGCYAPETKSCIASLNRQIEKLASSLKDTFIIVSSDHGMTDIESEILLHQIPELNECFVIPPFCEGRAMSFYIKYDKRSDFERLFASYFAGDFILLNKRDIIAKGILGRGKTHHKVMDFIGDYMACAVGGRILCYRTLNAKPKAMYLANHGGLTDKEMDIPLIMYGTPLINKANIHKIF